MIPKNTITPPTKRRSKDTKAKIGGKNSLKKTFMKKGVQSDIPALAINPPLLLLFFIAIFVILHQTKNLK